MFKRVLSLILALAVCLSITSTAFASEVIDYSEEALRVSDEFAAQYPNGTFSFSAVALETHEYSGRTVVDVLRQGGAAGDITVTIKSISITATYGEDYKLSIPGFIFDKKIEGSKSVPPDLSVTETTTPSAVSAGGSSTPSEVSADEASGPPKVSGVETTTPSAITETPSTAAPKNASLREVRQLATGKTSDREKLAPLTSQESSDLDTALAATEDFYKEAPGTVFNLSFSDGERKKSFNLDILNDDIGEAQEQIVFVITEVSSGGKIGLQKETTVNIIDDEPYEMPILRFSENSYTAAEDVAKITIKRSSGINYYAGATISTIGDNARAGTDYTEINQKVLFVPGQSELSLDIPITQNTSGVDKFFYVKLEPDKGCTLLGNEVVQVLIPKQTDISERLLKISESTLLEGTEAVYAGVANETISYDDLQFVNGKHTYSYKSSSGMHIFQDKDVKEAAYGYLRTNKAFYMQHLDSAKASIGLFDTYHKGGYNGNEALLRAFYTKSFSKSFIATLVSVKYWREEEFGKQILSDRIMSRGIYDSLKRQGLVRDEPFKFEFELTNREYPNDRAYLLVKYIDIFYRKIDFNINEPEPDTLHTFDLGKSIYSNGFHKEEPVTPGEIDIVSVDNSNVKLKGFYTSNDSMSFRIKAKNVRDGYYLKGMKILEKSDRNADYKFFDLEKTNTITLDHTWILNNSKFIYNNNMLIIQPVFERKTAKLTVSLGDNNGDKGEIVNVVNKVTPNKEYDEIKYINEKGKEQKYNLRVGDKVILTGAGKNDNMVSGYYISYNGGPKHSEGGTTNAGIHTITLTETVSVSPIFGAQLLNVKRDPTNKEQLPHIQGVLTYGATSTNGDGQLEGIKSGQYIEFVSIPPEGYTTLWANRTGDKNGNGVLDYDEVYDPNTHKLYRQYDYDMDGELDAQYDKPIYGDLFGYKVNQPNPIFYYYYESLSDRTLYSGKVSGVVSTREYTIRQGYKQVENANGEKVDSIVPVVGAAVRMGGSYNRNNPDAQLGYGTSTDSTGYFQFDVHDVLKNGSYLLSVEHNDDFYLDAINPSSVKVLRLPTFTSMKPISINGEPKGGEDPTTVSGSVVMIKDKEVDFILTTASLENNVKVEKAIFRIYTSNGTLESTTEVPVDGNIATLSVNLKSAFSAGAKMTVQLVDQNGKKSMEYNTGFQFRPPIQATSILPSFETPKEVPIPIIETVMGALDLGLARFTNYEVNDEGYTLRIGGRYDFKEKEKELKNTIDKAKKDDKEGEKAKEEIKKANKDAPKKEDSNLKVKSTLTNKLGIKVSLEMNIKYDADRDPALGSPYYFGHLLLMVTLEDKLTVETRIMLPIGLPLIVRLEVGGSVTGFIYITPYTPLGKIEPVKVYADKYGSYPYYQAEMGSPDRKFVVEGGVILEPYISLSVGVEVGIAEVSVEGKALFKLFFSTARSGSGTVTLTATVNVTTLGFNVYSKKFAEWSADLFGNPDDMPFKMLTSDDINDKEFEPIERDYLEKRSSWLGDLLTNPGPSMTNYVERTLMEGVYPYPDPQLMRIDDDSLLLVFIDDDVKRNPKNRGALYYSVSHDNGETFSQPELIDNDGTLDSNPKLKDVGSKIICIYSSLDRHITEGKSMEDILETNCLEMAVFDKSSYVFSEPIQVTKYTGRVNPDDGTMQGDYYTDAEGEIIFDEVSGKALIFYTKTDYTSDADEAFSAKDLFDSYNTIAYMIYDVSTNTFVPYSDADYPASITTEAAIQWNMDWYGQRFLNTEIRDASLPGGVLSDPLIMDLTTAQKDGTAYIAYSVDMDGKIETLTDRDIYMQTYDFSAQTFTNPIKVSDLEKDIQSRADERPRLIEFKGDIYLFYISGTEIHYYNLGSLLKTLRTGDPSAEPGDEGYQNLTPGVALEYSSDNVPSDYEVLVGDDGKLYMVWTEDTLRLADGIEPGSPEALKPENTYHENQIYASVLYDALDVIDDDGKIKSAGEHYGRWSQKVQVTAGPGSYDNPGLSIMADGRIVLAAKKSEKILVDDSISSPREEDLANTTFVTLNLTPIALPKMEKDSISFSSEYPMPGEVTTITAAANNQGLIPVLDPVVDFYAVKGNTETLIGSDIGSSPIYGGIEEKFSVNWEVPEDIENTKIIAKLRSQDDDTVTASTEKALSYGEKLEYGLFDVDHVAENYYRVYSEVYYKGNKPLNNAKLIINKVNTDDTLQEIKRVSIADTTANQDMFIINEGFRMSDADLSNGQAKIEVRIEVDDKLLARQETEVTKEIPALYRNLINRVTDVQLSAQEMSLAKGETGSITAMINPIEVGEGYNIVYVSLNPEVAAVSSEGVVRGLVKGSAVITAYAVPKVEVSIHNQDGYVVAGNILDTLSLESCKKASMTVNVREPQGGSSGSNSGSGSGSNSGSGSGATPVSGSDSGSGTMNLLLNGIKPASITENGYKVEFSSAAVSEILNGAESKNLTVSIQKLEANEKAQMYSISVKAGDTVIPGLNSSSIRISVPYLLGENENPNAVVVYGVNENGEMVVIPNCSYKDGMITFTTSDFNNFGIGHNPRNFTDVDHEAWYADAVAFITARDITAGVGNNMFAPGKVMTREEFATFIVSTFGFTWSGDKMVFSDVKEGSWYEQYVGALYEAGIINGTGNGKFGTGAFITRQDMATILYGALKKSGVELTKIREYDGFNDDENIAAYAQEAVRVLYEAGIIGGVENNNFAPTALATRGQMAVLIKNVLERIWL